MQAHSTQSGRRWFIRIAGVLLILSMAGAAAAFQARREFSVTAFKYGYRVSGTDQAEIRVQQNDLVKITFEAEDIPHSFTIDEYRISKRAEPGKPTVVEFRADKAGTFEFYCDLRIDDRCRRETRGTLIVTAK